MDTSWMNKLTDHFKKIEQEQGPGLALEEYCQKYNKTHKDAWADFLSLYEVDTEMTKELGYVVFNKIGDDPLVDLFSNPKFILRILTPKLWEYLGVRYQEWNDPEHPAEGKVLMEDDNIVINLDFDKNATKHVVLSSLPPDFKKYSQVYKTFKSKSDEEAPSVVSNYLSALRELVQHIATLPGGSIILGFLNRRPTVLAPWILWERHLQEQNQQKLHDLNNLNASINDMSIDDLQNTAPFSQSHGSYAKTQRTPIDAEFYLAELTPDSSIMDNSILKLLSNPTTTPIYNKTPKKTANFSRASKLAQSPYQKVSVKKSIQKSVAPGDGKSKFISKLALEFGDGDHSPNSRDDYSEEAHENLVHDKFGIDDITPIQKFSFNVNCPNQSTPHLTAIEDDTPENERETETLTGSSTLHDTETNSKEESKVLNSRLEKLKIKATGKIAEKIDDDCDSDNEESSSSDSDVENEQEQSTKSNDTDDLVRQASQVISQSSAFSQPKINKIFNKPGFKMEDPNSDSNSDDYGSEEEFTALIDRNGKAGAKPQNLKGKPMNITLNSKLTPIAALKDNKDQLHLFNESPVCSPLAKKSKPSSTPKQPVRKGPRTRSMNKSKNETGKQKESSIGSTDSRPAFGTVAKLTEKFSTHNSNNKKQTSSSATTSEDRSDRLGTLKPFNKNIKQLSAFPKPSGNSVSNAKLYGSEKPQSSYSAVQRAFNQKETISRPLSSSVKKATSKTRLGNASSQGPQQQNQQPSNLSSKPLITHNSGLSNATHQQNQGNSSINREKCSNIREKPIYETNITVNNPHHKHTSQSSKEKAEEIKLLRQKRQKEKEDKEKDRRRQVEDLKKKKQAEVAAKNKQKQEEVKKRREAAEQRRLKEMQKNITSHGSNNSRNVSGASKANSSKLGNSQIGSPGKGSHHNFGHGSHGNRDTPLTGALSAFPSSGLKELNKPMDQIDEADLEETFTLDRSRSNEGGGTAGAAEGFSNDEYNSSPNQYNATFSRERLPATESNYVIDDLDSGDETDENTAPRKPIPKWALGARLQMHINDMYPEDDADKFITDDDRYFAVAIDQKREDLDVSCLETSINRITQEEVRIAPLADIFYKKKDRFYNRGSTGIWKTKESRRRNVLGQVKY